MKRGLIYLLTNTNKTEGRRFYIGSKQEASIEEFDGVMTVLDRSDKPYYSSSSSIEMREEMVNGDIFEASLLEYVKDRKDLLAVEDKFIRLHDAVMSSEYYNKCNATMNCHDQDAVANKFGETVKELAWRNSSASKRDNTASKFGFSNFGEFHLWIKEKTEEGMTHSQISQILGKYRDFSGMTVKSIDLSKAKIEVLNTELYQDKLRKMCASGCSLYYAAELLGLELPSARIILGDYNKVMERGYRAAIKAGMSKDEMEIKIVQIILDSDSKNEGWKDAAKELNIGVEAVRRYFIRYVKRNMKRPD